jgi:hypothetical protein
VLTSRLAALDAARHRSRSEASERLAPAQAIGQCSLPRRGSEASPPTAASPTPSVATPMPSVVPVVCSCHPALNYFVPSSVFIQGLWSAAYLRAIRTYSDTLTVLPNLRLACFTVSLISLRSLSSMYTYSARGRSICCAVRGRPRLGFVGVCMRAGFLSLALPPWVRFLGRFDVDIYSRLHCSSGCVNLRIALNYLASHPFYRT